MYDRLRRVEKLRWLLARFARHPFRSVNDDWRLDAARIERIKTRLLLVLWELPPSLQTGLCVALAQRTLPAFEQGHPTLTSMRDFLNPDWIRERSGVSGKAGWEQLGYELNALREALDEQFPTGRDEFLYGAACGLWDALEPDATPAVFTSACVYSAYCAVSAERNEAWESLDPTTSKLPNTSCRLPFYSIRTH